MLFADIVGFSKLREEHMPAFWSFMRAVEARMGRTREIPLLVESWGDALYVAADGARALADYAMTLKNAMSDIEGADHGLPTDLQLRIGLHAGPVFEGENPLTGRKIVYGSHVNRAARIEPVALPGNIYASHQFVALLEREESAARNEARTDRRASTGRLDLPLSRRALAGEELWPPGGLRDRAALRRRPGGPAMSAPLRMTLANNLAAHLRLAEALTAWAAAEGIDPALVTTFELAFDEVLANIVSYAYDDGGEHAIEVSCSWDGTTLSAEVVDDGKAFDPLRAPPPDLDSSLEERAVGGLGLFLVRELMDEVRYRREEGRNHLRLAKRQRA